MANQTIFHKLSTMQDRLGTISPVNKKLFPYIISKSRLTIDDLGNISPNNGIKFESDAISSFQMYYKFAFYLLICPYKIINPDGDGPIVFESSVFRKIMCGVFQASSVLTFLNENRTIFPLKQKIHENPFQISRVILVGFTFYSIVVFIYIHWAQHLRGLYISSIQQKRRILSNYKWNGCNLSQLICFLPVIITGFRMVTAVITFVNTPGAMAVRFIPRVSTGSDYKESVSSSGTTKFFSFIVFLLRSYYDLLFLNTVAFAYLCCWVIYRIGCDFNRFLVLNPNALLKQIIQGYMDLKTVLETINKFVSRIMFTTLIQGLAAFSNIFITLDNGSLSTQIEILLHLTIFVLFLNLASEGNSKIQVFGDFIFKNWQEGTYGNDPSVSVILVEAFQNVLGLKVHTFTITYSFVATTLGTVLTYVIIVLQFQVSQVKNGAPRRSL